MQLSNNSVGRILHNSGLVHRLSFPFFPGLQEAKKSEESYNFSRIMHVFLKFKIKKNILLIGNYIY